jgi:hypothetical protein
VTDQTPTGAAEGSDDDPATHSPFDTVTDEQVLAGTATDAYFRRTHETLTAADRNPTVVAEVTVDQFPTGEFDLLAGVGNAVELLTGRECGCRCAPTGDGLRRRAGGAG